jgi:hypothetical protein
MALHLQLHGLAQPLQQQQPSLLLQLSSSPVHDIQRTDNYFYHFMCTLLTLDKNTLNAKLA